MRAADGQAFDALRVISSLRHHNIAPTTVMISAIIHTVISAPHWSLCPFHNMVRGVGAGRGSGDPEMIRSANARTDRSRTAIRGDSRQAPGKPLPSSQPPHIVDWIRAVASQLALSIPAVRCVSDCPIARMAARRVQACRLHGCRALVLRHPHERHGETVSTHSAAGERWAPKYGWRVRCVGASRA
jgi:hypothetical protein